MQLARLRRIAPNPIERLRRLKGTVQRDTDTVKAAITRIFKTPEGLIFLDWLIARSYGRSVSEKAGDSALRANEVRKKFVDEILTLSEDYATLAGPGSQRDTPNKARRPAG